MKIQRSTTVVLMQKGFFTTSQAIESGYRRNNHGYHVKRGNWKRIEYGLYRLNDLPHFQFEKYMKFSLSEVTPWRACDCPYCGVHWHNNWWKWDSKHLNELECTRCHKLVDVKDFPDNDYMLVKDPQGNEVKIPVHKKDGKTYTIRCRLSFARFTYASSGMNTLGEAYLLTGEKQFAEKALVLMRRMAEVYPGYALKDWVNFYEKPTKLSGKLGGWCYEDAIHIGRAARLYDAFKCNNLISKEDARLIEENLLRKAGEMLVLLRNSCINDMPHRYGGIASIARVLNDRKMMHYVLNDTFGFAQFTKEKWTTSGFFNQRSPGYTEMALQHMHFAPTVLLGYVPEPGATPMDLRKELHFIKIYRSLYDLTFPDGIQFTLADNTPGRPVNKMWAEVNYAWFGGIDNLNCLARVYGGKHQLLKNGDDFAFYNRPSNIDQELRKISVNIPMLPSQHFEKIGVTIMRGGDKENRTVAYLDYGGRDGDVGHQHFDCLNMVLWAHGHEMAGDIGYGKYGWRNHLREPWRIQSLSHNLVVVNSVSQTFSTTQHEKPYYEFCNEYNVAEVQAPSVYNISEYRRTLALLTPKGEQPFVVDIFRVDGGKTHDWSYHAQTEEPICIEQVDLKKGKPLGTDTAYKQLTEIRSGITDLAWQATFRWREAEKSGLRVWMAGAPKSLVSTARVTGQMETQVPILIVRREGENLRSTFISVQEPFRKQPRIQSVSVLECKSDGRDWGVILEVVTPGNIWRVASKISDQPWQNLPWKTDAILSKRFIVLKDTAK